MCLLVGRKLEMSCRFRYLEMGVKGPSLMSLDKILIYKRKKRGIQKQKLNTFLSKNFLVKFEI